MAMTYEEIKNKTLERYGDIDAIPDSVYQALKDYQTNGDAALDNDRTWNILKSEKEYQSKTQPTTYSYNSPEDYELLKRNISEVGYSGLDDNQKALFESQFSASKFARAGGSFDDAVKYVDSQAYRNTNPDTYISLEDAAKRDANAGSAYTLGRNILSLPVGLGMTYLEYYKDRLFGEGGGPNKKTGQEYYKEALELGNTGEGATGMLSAPENVIPIGGATKLQQAVRGAEVGSGLGAYDYYTNSEQPKIEGVIGAGIGGGLVGGLGSTLFGGPLRRQTIKEAEVNALREAEREALERVAYLDELRKANIDPTMNPTKPQVGDFAHGLKLKGEEPARADVYGPVLQNLRRDVDDVGKEQYYNLLKNITNDADVALAKSQNTLRTRQELPLYQPELKDFPITNRISGLAGGVIDKNVNPILQYTTNKVLSPTASKLYQGVSVGSGSDAVSEKAGIVGEFGIPLLRDIFK